MTAQGLLQGLFDHPRLGVVITNKGGTVESANGAFTRWLEHDVERLQGLVFRELIAPLPQGEQEVDGREIVPFLTNSGREVWGELIRTPLPEGGEVVLVHDRSEARYEQRLFEGRAQVLEKLYHDADLGSICHAIVAYIESVARGVYCSILLLDPERGTLHKTAAPSLPDFYNDAIDGMKIGDGVGSCGTAAFRGERVIVADILAHPFWARARRLVERTPLRSCWSEPIISGNGKILGTFAVYSRTPREPNGRELALIRSAAELAALAIDHKRADMALLEADRLKDEFISLAAHELRTPVTSLLGYTELLIDTVGGESPEGQTFLREINHAGERLIGLVDDLLDLSKIHSGVALTVDRRPVTLRPLIDKVIRPLRQQTRQHHFPVVEETPLPEKIVCDEWRVMQLFENLLGNAVKYSPDGGEIVTRLRVADGFLHVTVADQGIGMTPEQQAQAFNKFYRGKESQALASGLGLGLSIVRHIVIEHGGEIRLDSHPGAGTAVHFTLAMV